jgi:hypothetical protein
MKIPSDPGEILTQLSDLSSAVHDGLNAGSVEVRDYFERRSREVGYPVEINTTMAMNIMRYVTLLHVQESRRVGTQYYLEEMKNNGISARFDWCHVKVYKTLGEEPPTAHNTHASRNFYGQARPIQWKLPGIAWESQWHHKDWDEIAPTLDIANLIYGWEVDANYNVIRVQLFCPRVSGKYKQGVKLFWRRDVPHPILGIIGLPTVNDRQGVDDLPVFFEDASEQDD